MQNMNQLLCKYCLMVEPSVPEQTCLEEEIRVSTLVSHNLGNGQLLGDEIVISERKTQLTYLLCGKGK